MKTYAIAIESKEGSALYHGTLNEVNETAEKDRETRLTAILHNFNRMQRALGQDEGERIHIGRKKFMTITRG